MGFLEIRPNLQAIEMADIKRGELVLDIGFGTGWCLERLIPYVGAATPVYGIDFSTGMREETLRNLKKKGLDGSVRLYMGNVKNMPFEDGKFDVLFASFLLDLMEDEDSAAALAEMKRILKPNGRLIVVSMTKNGNGVFKGARLLYEWMYHKWPTILGYRPSSRPIYVENNVKKAGFTIDKYILSYITGFLFPIGVFSARVK